MHVQQGLHCVHHEEGSHRDRVPEDVQEDEAGSHDLVVHHHRSQHCAQEKRNQDDSLADQHHRSASEFIDEEATHEHDGHLEETQDQQGLVSFCVILLNLVEQLLGVLKNSKNAGGLIGDRQHNREPFALTILKTYFHFYFLFDYLKGEVLLDIVDEADLLLAVVIVLYFGLLLILILLLDDWDFNGVHFEVPDFPVELPPLFAVHLLHESDHLTVISLLDQSLNVVETEKLEAEEMDNARANW